MNNIFKCLLWCFIFCFLNKQESFAQIDSLVLQEVSNELRVNYSLLSAPANFDTLNVYLGEQGNPNSRSYQGIIIYSTIQHCTALVLNNSTNCFTQRTDTINGKILSRHEVSFNLSLLNYSGERKAKIYLAKKYNSQYFIRERYF